MRAATKMVLGIVCATAGLSSTASASYVSDVPAGERAGYQMVYDLAIPTTSPGWDTAGVLTGASGYSTNNSGSIANGSFSRVAYYFELGGATAANSPNGFVYVSFNAPGFTNRADQLGVPGTTTGAVFQQNIANMTVMSNVAGVVTGSGITTGNIEFWGFNYAQGNGRPAGNGGAVPNASASTYDFGDTNSASGTHGSMQIHNYDLDGAGAGTAGQTLFAYNAWGTVRTSEVGIGNNPNTTQAPDWTLAANAGNWTTKNLQVFVLVPEPSTIGVAAGAAFGLLARRRRTSSQDSVL